MRNISLSTCGVVPQIDRLAQYKLQLTLSILPPRPQRRHPQQHDAGEQRLPHRPS